MKKLSFLILALTLSFSLACEHSFAASARDASWLANTANMSPNIKKAKNIGVPIGTVIAWPYATLPADGEWLECNGQTVSATAYPEFAAKFGTATPNYQGMFLRGHGSQEYVQNNGSYRSVSEQTTKHVSGSLGSIQGDSVREAWGNMLSRPLDTDTSTTETVNSSIWPAAVGNNGFFRLVSRGSAYLPVNYEHFSAKIPSYISQIRLSFMLPTANEIRPINIAVKYIIKVK